MNSVQKFPHFIQFKIILRNPFRPGTRALSRWPRFRKICHRMDVVILMEKQKRISGRTQSRDTDSGAVLPEIPMIFPVQHIARKGVVLTF